MAMGNSNFLTKILKTGRNYLLLISSLLVSFFVSAQNLGEVERQLEEKFRSKRVASLFNGYENYSNGKRVALDSIYWSSNKDTLVFEFGKSLAEMPIREEYLAELRDSLLINLSDSLKNYPINVRVNGVLLEELIPNYYRKSIPLNHERLKQRNTRIRSNVVEKESLYQISNGLDNSNIALWHSHGWYYESTLDRWEWQRARLFTTLEDISPAAFVLPYITPMLENAGANVFIPRERDWQSNEVIVDNNGSTGKGKFIKPKKRTGEQSGFASRRQLYTNENPFKIGTSVAFESSKKENKATYIPDFPETGGYGVYVSYGIGEGEVTYRVHHTGGTTDFVVDQSLGYGTWIYLDKFKFNKGMDKKASKVELIVPGGVEKKYSADAVRFGGGMGVVERNGKTGGRAKFFEGSRYYLQYAGAPDTLVWSFNNGEDDYKDDYMSRGEWVDWLMGNPYGPTKNRQHPGLGIPIDLAFAFHTDAGILPHDEIVGTLGIYSTDREETSRFPDGQSKYASRDLTDLIQTQIIEDINAIYQCNWTRRGMWNAQYSEAYRPQVPTMLLELLSHQNLNDVKFLLNPQFRFDVSRAIYKSMLRFIATQNAYDYVVQPLPVDHLASKFVGSDEVKISWQPVFDELEPSAKAEKYMVYQRTGENGFDNGTLVDKPEITISNLEKGKVYGFKVAAVNDGGESFPSEVLSIGIAEKSKGNALIVNGFDRIDGPAIFECDSLAGVLRQLDNGVAYHYDIGTTGDQYDFDRKSPWLDDDSPGHGASYADLETTIFRGNTFDFSFQHGASLLANGYSFVSTSDEAVENGSVDLNDFKLIDLIYGEEKTSVFPGKDSSLHFEIYTKQMLKVLETFTQNGGDIILSGAYIGSEIPKNKEAVQRIGEIFGFKWRTNHAVKNGQFYSVSDDVNFSGEFNTDFIKEQYAVEAPDGIEPKNDKGQTIFRYGENNVSAGVFYKGKHKVISLGFPFETVRNAKDRNELMKQILKLLEQ